MTVQEITAKQLQQKLAAGEKLNIIDVREADETAAGMIPGAKHIPLGQIPDRLRELNKNELYYIICRSGGRSGKACQFLNAHGYKAVNIAGGMLEWEGDTE